jgi:hypothetical protein
VSAQNVELHRRLLAAFNAHDLEAFIAGCDPGIEYHSVMTGPFGTVYRWRDGLLIEAKGIPGGKTHS